MWEGAFVWEQCIAFAQEDAEEMGAESQADEGNDRKGKEDDKGVYGLFKER